MAASTTLTVRLPSKVKTRLGRLAKETRRTNSYLAGEAIAQYVESELDIIEGIKQGLKDMRAGRVVPHEQAMAELDETIERAIRRAGK
jgi:predicted transcriptional regulator